MQKTALCFLCTQNPEKGAVFCGFAIKNTATVRRRGLRKENRMHMEKLAQAFRKIARPPIFAVAFLLIVFTVYPAAFGSVWQLLCGIATLGVLPLLGYPLQKYIPPFKEKGREGQRSLAMLFCFAGYLLGTVIALLTDAPEPLLMIYLCYLSCGIGMLLFNKVFHLKASGHACGIMGPIFAMLLYFKLYVPALIGALLAVLVFASSVKTKEHTAGQLWGGTAIAAVCITALSVCF